jgi:Aldehyde dehydrogenase family
LSFRLVDVPGLRVRLDRLLDEIEVEDGILTVSGQHVGPVLAATYFKDEAEALEIANDTMYGLGAGVWARAGSRAFRIAGRSMQAACGPTATTSTRRMPRSAATRPPVSVERTIR